jgi:phage-related protein
MKNKKQFQAHFFQTPSGNVPVLDWIKSFGEDDRRIIGKAIQKVEIGGPQIGKPTVDGIGDGLYEIRCIVTNGTTEARILFTVSGTSLLLLHGFIKKTNALSKHDRTLAKQRLAEAKRTNQP